MRTALLISACVAAAGLVWFVATNRDEIRRKMDELDDRLKAATQSDTADTEE